jgi:hypothetical protein
MRLTLMTLCTMCAGVTLPFLNAAAQTADQTLDTPKTSAENINEEPAESWQDLSNRIKNTSFLWLRDPSRLQNFVSEGRKNLPNVFSENITFFENLGGVALDLSAQTAQQALTQIAPADSSKFYIEPNGMIVPFASGCNETPEDFNTVPDGTTPVNVERVGTVSTVAGKKVWIVDSGISDNFDSYLTVNRWDSLLCRYKKKTKQYVCDPDPANLDRFGHGTMIAGIIGGKVKQFGVAPNVELVPIKIFTNSDVTDFGVAYKALDTMAGKAAFKTGDVVNISWGADWNPTPNSTERQIETVLRNFADSGRRVAVAAGNIEESHSSGYLQLVSPARAGNYVPNVNGGVFAVTAVQSTKIPGGWIDSFWNELADGVGSNYGNGGEDVAEPGVEIKSMWPVGANRKWNICTGTSFAAAHLSGILVKGNPGKNGRALNDPSAVRVHEGSVTIETSAQDQIGVVP